MKKIIFTFLIFFALIGIGCVAATDVDVAHNHIDCTNLGHHDADGPSSSLDDPWGYYRPLHPNGNYRPGILINSGNPFDSWGSGNRVL